MLFPNGGETLLLGGRYTVSWDASATSPGVESVDLYLSRSGPGGPWELIAAGAPNRGTYEWKVTGSSQSNNCYLRADARDYAGDLSSDVSDAAFSIISGALAVGPGSGVTRLAIGAVAPNPARMVVRIEYALPHSGVAALTLADVQGRVARVLLSGTQTGGSHTFSLATFGLRPGLYFLRLQSGGEERTRRLVILN